MYANVLVAHHSFCWHLKQSCVKSRGIHLREHRRDIQLIRAIIMTFDLQCN